MLIKETEKSKVHLIEVPGMCTSLPRPSPLVNVMQMDQDYQMIDTHIEELLRKKILNFEFVDFAKLLV